MKNLMFLSLFFLFLFGCLTTSQTKYTQIKFQPSGTEVRAEIADTDYLKTKGLMYRNSLEANDGMLFIYDEQKQLVFWMANTKIPLDILYLDENKTIVDIQQMEPCNETILGKCKKYPSSSPAVYAIELNKGFAQKNGIQIGNKANWD
jgi:uncharacterized protein